MQIKFADQLIASEPTHGGTDGIEGFEPSGEQDVQIDKPLRATWSKRRARENRSVTISGVITPKPFVKPGTAVRDMLMRFSTYPKQGDLVFIEDDLTTTFADAALKTFKALKRDGVSYAVELTFLCGEATEGAINHLVTEDGSALKTESGDSITY